MAFAPIRRTDNSLLGTQEITGTPAGRENATPQQVQEWLQQRHQQPVAGKVFRNLNTHFLLDWAEIDIPDPAFHRRDQDLCLIAFPEVESPYKFPEYIYRYDDKPWASAEIPPSAEYIPPNPTFVIKPPLYDDNLTLINPDVEVRKIAEGSYTDIYLEDNPIGPNGMPSGSFVPKGTYGVRVYTTTDPSGMIPVKAVRPGAIYNQPAGQKLMCAPRHWLAEGYQNSVYGLDYTEVAPTGPQVAGQSAPAGTLLLMSSGRIPKYLEAMGIGPSNYQFDDDFWDWYKWNDGADEYRKAWYNMFQAHHLPRRGEGWAMLLSDVTGMSLGGNDGKVWIDPIYLDSISKINYHKIFRDVSHCYKVDKCNFATKTSDTTASNGKVFLIEEAGFRRNKYAQVSDGDIYCPYRQSEPEQGWKSTMERGQSWDRFCKYAGVPQRAVEYDGNYKVLLEKVLKPFRRDGIFHWVGWNNGVETANAKQESVEGGYKLVTLKPMNVNDYDMGQMANMLGYTVNYPVGTTLFFYKTSAPSEWPTSSNEDIAGYEEHKNSRLFAYLWQYVPSADGNTHVPERWLVELKDDYISPMYRVSEFEVFEPITGGENPFIRDKSKTGKNNGGLRPYLVRDKDTGLWKTSAEPYDINPNGFFNLEGGRVQLTGLNNNYASMFWNAQLPPVFVNVPSCLARGKVRAIGLPGEVIQRDTVMWKPPTVVKWDHIQEIYDRLFNPTIRAEEYPSAMEPSESGNGEKRKFEPNHILVGTFQDSVAGTGMVSNGDTPYSDIVLATDILHARNMTGPMIAYKLGTYIPSEQAEYFDDDVQDFATRQQEPHELTVQRFGYRIPPVYTFMTCHYNGTDLDQDVSYTMLLPPWENPWSGWVPEGEQGITIQADGSKANRIFRVHHPNGMRWWRDSGLLGAGVQYGQVKYPEQGYWGELGAKGHGLQQIGKAVLNMWRRYLPLDKEVVKAYLRLVPSNAHDIGNTMIQTYGGGRQWTIGNTPFYNLSFNSQEWENYTKLNAELASYGLVEYEYRLIWADEHPNEPFTYSEQKEFCKHLQFKKYIMGDFAFPFNKGPAESSDSAYHVTKPTGANDRLFFYQYDYEKTKTGQTLEDIRLRVSRGGSTPLEFLTSQRSYQWYNYYVPYFMRGMHSKTDLTGLGTRMDYDEGGDVNGPGTKGNFAGRTLGFGCSSGGAAKDWRVFDVTQVVQQSYLQDRMDVTYNPVIDLKLSEMGEPYNLSVTRPIPKSGYIALGEVPVNERVTYETSPNFYGILNGSISEWGNADPNSLNIAVINLKQVPPPRRVEGVAPGDDAQEVPNNRKLRDNCIIKRVAVTTSGSFDAGASEIPFLAVFGKPKKPTGARIGGWRLIAANSNPAGYCAIDHTFSNPVQFREIKIVTNLIVTSASVEGWITEDFLGQCPMTSPPIYETHRFSRAIIDKTMNKREGDFTLCYLEFPATKIYEVTICPVKDDPSPSTTGVKRLPRGTPAVKLTYIGVYNVGNKPRFTWAQDASGEWYITEGEYAYSPAMNAVILPVLEKWVDDEKKADLLSLGACISYVTGRGAKANLKIEASGTGPSWDVDPDSIVEITQRGIDLLSFPPTGGFYGQSLLPWSCTNPNELQGGYLQGDLPTHGNVPILENAFKVKNGENNAAWKSKCKGVLELYGEPDWPIEGGEFMAPAYVRETDPVTGELLSNNIVGLTGIDPYNRPNGGRKPFNLLIELSATDSNPDYSSDGPYRKKQVAYVPEFYIFLRERVSKKFGDTQWGLTLDQ